MGGMMGGVGGTIFARLAAGFVGSVIAQQFLGSMDGCDDEGEQTGDEEIAGGAEDDSGDYGSDSGDYGGDFGGGDFGGGDF